MGNGSRQNEESAAAGKQATIDVAYRASRENMIQLIEAHPDAADQMVPACPDWTVRDLIAHVVDHCRSEAIPYNQNAQSLPPVSELSLSELLDEWKQTGPQVEELLADKDGREYRVWVMDMFTHELDLRRAVQAPPPNDHPAFPTAFQVVIGGLSASVNARGLPALRIETQDGHWVVGSGEETATVHGHPLDLYRSIAGRRTYKQITELSWTAPAETWLPAFTWGPFNPPANATEDMIGAGDPNH